MNLKEIAREANVSTSTVSLVLNNRKGVGRETREQITRLLEENGYQIGDSVKSSPERKSIRFLKYSKHGFLVNENVDFVSSIIDSIEKEARKTGYNLIMTVFNDRNLPEVLEMIRSEPPDGIVLLGSELENKDIEPYLNELTVPVVVVDNFLFQWPTSCVIVNNEEAIFSAVRYLADLGHPKIGYLYSTLPGSNCILRRNAYENAIKRFKLPYDPSLIYPLHPTLTGSYENVHALLQQGVHFPSALVANNDRIALGAIKAFKEAGKRVPEDISVIGFDNIPFSAVYDPPLTTMSVPCRDIGIWTVRLLCDRIAYPNAPATKIQVCASLIERKSTCVYNIKQGR